MTISLRPYQADAADRVWKSCQAGGTPLLAIPTGGGKTEVAISLAQRANARTLFLTSRLPLIPQTVERFRWAGLSAAGVGSFSGSAKWPKGGWPSGASVVVATPQTAIGHRLEEMGIRLAVIDESHHAARKDGVGHANTYASCALRLQLPRKGGKPLTSVFGMTATPARLEADMGFDRVFTDIVNGPSYRQLADDGYLAPLDVLRGEKEIRGGKVDRLKRDYTERGILDANDREVLVDLPCADIAEREGQAIVFAVESVHASQVANQLAEAHGEKVGLTLSSYDHCEIAAKGVIASYDESIAAFRSGDVRCLVSVQVPVEGIDLPSAEMAVVLRPTMSEPLWLQMCGRVSRPADGKARALVLDWGNNTDRLGRPDEEREWSLLSRKRQEEMEKEPPGAKAPSEGGEGESDVDRREALRKNAAEEIRASGNQQTDDEDRPFCKVHKALMVGPRVSKRGNNVWNCRHVARSGESRNPRNGRCAIMAFRAGSGFRYWDPNA